MMYDLIAAFYTNADDRKPRYRVLVNTISASGAEELIGKGFREDPDSTDGYADLVIEVTEETLEPWCNGECGIEIIPILDGNDYGKILIHAYELETIDGEIPPRGAGIGDNTVYFTGLGDGMVVFRHGSNGFTRELDTLKRRLSVLTMFEVMDNVMEFFRTDPDEEEIRSRYGSGLDEAIRLAACRFHGMFDYDDNPAVLHSLEVSRMGQTPDERIAGCLHDVVEDTDTTFDELLDMGFTHHVVDTVRLLTHDKREMSYEDYVRNIISSGNDTAVNVKLNDLRHNISRGRATAERARESGCGEMFVDITAINRKHERALEMIMQALNVDPEFSGEDLGRYRYFHGEKECPFNDDPSRTFWMWERMYCTGFQRTGREQCWASAAEALVMRHKRHELPDDPRIGRIMGYELATLQVFCYICEMTGKWFPYDESLSELEY